jgi:signal transduction histidine kinase/CheY-like chemotaxis protein
VQAFAPDHNDAASRAELEAELRKLRKINRVLMDRVERDVDAQGGNAYALFRTAVTLEAKVSERTAELAKLTHQMMHEISQRRLVEKALIAAKAEAEQANASKTRFLAAASHDLHQPFNAARLFLGALADEVTTDRARDLLARVDAALDTVDDLLGSLLDISRLDAGAWPVTLAPLPVGPLLARLLEEYGPQARSVGIDLRVVPCAAVIQTDRALFERVLRNLISNAIRYTASGRVLVGCRRRGDHVRLDVLDTGVGIPKDRQNRIFEEFHRLGNAPRNDGKGLGLGLAIVDRIARLLDLRVDFESEAGRGSRFTVLAPYGEATGAEDSFAAMPVAALDSLAGRHVLLIENDAAAVEGMRALLQSWGCAVTASGTAAAALADLSASGPAPDLLIVDYHLDDDAVGTEAVAEVRARCGAAFPALVVSGDRSAEIRARMKASGLPFLPKPTSPARLRAMMSYLLRNAVPG